MRPEASVFDSELFELRVAWASAPCADLDVGGLDLVFLRGPYPTSLHPCASLLDVRLDLRGIPRHTAPCEVRRAEDDADCVFAAELGADAFAAHSRYFADARLITRAPDLYRHWVRAAHRRRDLYTIPGRGFFCVSRQEDVLRLDLIAVAKDQQRNGVGSDLVHAFLALPSGVEHRVKVEAGNISAINFYFANGFTAVTAESVQHLWFHDS